MSPILMLVLMFSAVALLLVAWFAVRKKQAGEERGNSEQKDDKEKQEQKGQNEELGIDLGSLDLSGLGDLGEEFIERNEKNHHSNQTGEMKDEKEKEKAGNIEVLELVKNYKFFQGENLVTFEKLLNDGDREGIQQMIEQRFEIQGKENPKLLAESIIVKLGL